MLRFSSSLPRHLRRATGLWLFGGRECPSLGTTMGDDRRADLNSALSVQPQVEFLLPIRRPQPRSVVCTATQTLLEIWLDEHPDGTVHSCSPHPQKILFKSPGAVILDQLDPRKKLFPWLAVPKAITYASKTGPTNSYSTCKIDNYHAT